MYFKPVDLQRGNRHKIFQKSGQLKEKKSIPIKDYLNPKKPLSD
jgi:hypothetical protein